jgi:hypothetical protein
MLVSISLRNYTVTILGLQCAPFGVAGVLILFYNNHTISFGASKITES